MTNQASPEPRGIDYPRRLLAAAGEGIGLEGCASSTPDADWPMPAIPSATNATVMSKTALRPSEAIGLNSSEPLGDRNSAICCPTFSSAVMGR
jgi:hypothetical protein